MTPAAATVFDPELALKRCLNKPDLLQQMIAFFFNDADNLLPQIRAALEKGDSRKSAGWGTDLRGRWATLRQSLPERPRDVWNTSCCMPADKPKRKRPLGAFEWECEVLHAVLTKYQCIRA